MTSAVLFLDASAIIVCPLMILEMVIICAPDQVNETLKAIRAQLKLVTFVVSNQNPAYRHAPTHALPRTKIRQLPLTKKPPN